MPENQQGTQLVDDLTRKFQEVLGEAAGDWKTARHFRQIKQGVEPVHRIDSGCADACARCWRRLIFSEFG
ncbi:hypothetical protein [Verrucomicrobium sp. BvORR034]|jgi:hypothetical protein|uniref:hypothetical protein n=1 Tax=Verrucomicrobium sp. BvORR034 TaxID=1396418 RepID=UPI000678DA97|nr:hypothetical protein [Verrucomicrobium sp. BvORR034]